LTDLDYNMPQTYTVRRIDSSTGSGGQVLASGLRMPPSNIGPRVTPDYETNLAQPAIYPLGTGGGRVFVGQRDEGFFIDVGAVFDAAGFRSVARPAAWKPRELSTSTRLRLKFRFKT
jgi:hypothetical protein